jgi:hypothetical protein
VEIKNIHGIVVRIPIPYQITITETLKMKRTETLLDNKQVITESKPTKLMQSKIILLPDT